MDQFQTSNSKETPELSFIAKFIATGFYSGYAPWASGTVGSFVGLLIYLIPGVERVEILGSLIVLGFVAGVITSAKVAAAVGNRLAPAAKKTKELFQGGIHETPDPSIVVIDEIVGMWVSLIFFPKSLWVVVVAFLLFRTFDIIKPPPARQLERFPNGWGIMLDDVMAGIYANILVRIIAIIFPNIF